jgi:photosystem II stability/assembly factor-like uncharacterized protein
VSASKPNAYDPFLKISGLVARQLFGVRKYSKARGEFPPTFGRRRLSMNTEICIVRRKAQLAKTFLAAITLLAILKTSSVWAAGDEWNGLGPDGAKVESILLDAQNPEIVYAGINGLGFARTNVESKRLTISNDGMLSSIVLSLVEDPHKAGTIYAGTGGAGVYKSADGGKHWTPANKGIDLKTIQSLAADPQHSGTLYAGTWGDGVYITTNGGQEWKSIGESLAGAFVYALEADPTKAGRLIAGTSTGAWQTTDGGKTWTKFTAGIPEGIVEVVAFNPKNFEEILLAVNNWVPGKQYVGAVVRSEDGGKSWKAAGTGIPETRILSLALDPENTKAIYAGTEKGVFVSTDGSQSWAAFGSQPKTPEVGTLAVSSKAPARLFAGTRGGGVFATTLTR